MTLSRDLDDKCFLRVWNPNDGQMVKSRSTGLTEAESILVLFDGQVALGFQNGDLRVIDFYAVADVKITKWKAHERHVSAIFQFLSGQLLSSGQDEILYTTLKLWDMRDLSLLQQIRTGRSLFCSFALSRDGKLLASGLRDASIKFLPIKP